MNKLMFAGFKRLFKNKLFWLCCIAMFIFAAVLPFITKEDTKIEKVFFVFSVVIGVIFSAFSGLFIGTEYGEGTIRNKLVIGHRRYCIYLSNFLICAAAGIIMQLFYTLAMCTIGICCLKAPEIDFGVIAYLYAISILVTIAFASIYTMLGMLISRRSGGVVASILLAIFLTVFAVVCNSRLNEPEYQDYYIYTDQNGSISEGDKVLNPNYLTGTKRAFWQFIYDFQPMGQALQLATIEITNVHRLPFYSITVILLTTGVGLFFFRKKDIK